MLMVSEKANKPQNIILHIALLNQGGRFLKEKYLLSSPHEIVQLLLQKGRFKCAWYIIKTWKLFNKWQIPSCFLSTNAQILLLPPSSFSPIFCFSTDLNAVPRLPF